MPWTKDDFPDAFKNLSEEEREKATRIANAILRDCLEGGGEQSACEGKAIRIALATVTEEGVGIVSETTQLAEKHSLAQVVANFRNKVRGVEIAVDIVHDPDRGAAGWIKELKTTESSSQPGKLALWARPEWTDLGKELAGSVYRYVSAEIGRHVDAESGNGVENVLFAVTLTNRPYVKGMLPVTGDDQWIEVLREGDYLHPEYGELKIQASEATVLQRIVSRISPRQGPDAGEVRMAVKTEDGVEYPASAYLYVPDPDLPSGWKLRIKERVNGKLTVTHAQLGRAAAALSPSGFRGQRADLPREEYQKLKAKLKGLYRDIGVEEDEMPAYLRAEEGRMQELKVLLTEKGIPVEGDEIAALGRWMEGQAGSIAKLSEAKATLEGQVTALQGELTAAKTKAGETDQANQALSTRVEKLEKTLAERDRETFLAEMIRKAHVAPADLDKWRKRYDEHPATTRDILSEMKPLVDMGTRGADSAGEPDTLEDRRAAKLTELLKEGVAGELAYARVMTEIR